MKPFSLLLLTTLLASPALADTTVIEAPGFQVESRQGWFGTSERRYKDAMGNEVRQKRGLFGRETTDTQVMGTRVQRRGDNLTVMGKDGKPLVSQKRRWFGLGPRETRVNATGVLNQVNDLFNTP